MAQSSLTRLGHANTDAAVEFAHDVFTGLSDTPRWLPCKYLYDQRGSELYESICDQSEYYPTRTEAAILERCARDIQTATGPVSLIELGSGTSVKTDYLLDAYTREGGSVHYVPVDVSESALQIAADAIIDRRPRVTVEGIVGTYETAFHLFRDHSPAMVVFLGSTIGNLNDHESNQFLTALAGSVSQGDYFLLGVDLVKDHELISAAYNDAAGVTAQFTTNVFARMNRELNAGVDLDQIKHVATYEPARQRMEIFVEFLTEQIVNLAPVEKRIRVGAGEKVMIEISHKFVLGDLTEHVAQFGFDVQQTYTDENQWFGLLLMKRTDG